MNKQNFLNCNITFYTNFNPVFFKKFKLNFKIKKKQKIFAKNFLFFLILLNFFKKKFNFYKTSVFIKPKKSTFITVLRPPYKNKLSRHQLVNTRYFINFKLIVPINLKKNTQLKIFKKYLIFFKNFFFFFETNLIYQHKTKFYLDYVFNKNFIINC